MNAKVPRVLFVASREFDYLQDMIFRGLTEVLGEKNIDAIPFNAGYHFPIHRYPKNLGYFGTPPLSRFFWNPSRIKGYDAVIVGSTKPDTFQAYQEILPKIQAHQPVVFIDGGDFSDVGGDLRRLHAEDLWKEVIRQRPFDFVFKREMVNEQSYEKNVFPLPFGLHHQITDRPTPILKTYDVSFWAVESHPIRSQVFSLLKGKFDCDQNGSCAKQVFRKYSRKGEQYLQDLAQTKVSLNFRGVGWDTLRFWETFGVGTMMISQKPAIQIPNDFINGSEVVYLEDGLDSLIDQCRYYLDHSDERERIAKRGQQKAQKFHSAKFRAEQVLSKIFG